MFGEEFLIAAAIASTLASLGGTAASMSAQNSIRKKQSAARAAEAARQRDIDRRRNIEMQNALPEHTVQNQQEKQQSIADTMMQYMTPQNVATEYMAGDTSAPREIKDSMSRQMVDALQKGKDYAKNLAQVSSLSRLNLDNKLGMNRLGERMGMLNSESQRSANLFPMEMDSSHLAGTAGNSAATILNGVGGIADAVVKANILHRGGLDDLFDGLLGDSQKALPKGSPLPLNSYIG